MGRWANDLFTIDIGSGCIAALEAEKFLAESEGGDEPPLVTSTLEQSTIQGRQGAPSLEYSSNPLL